jgi:hypothetical protein
MLVPTSDVATNFLWYFHLLSSRCREKLEGRAMSSSPPRVVIKSTFYYGHVNLDFPLTVEPLPSFWCYHTADMMGL